MGWIDDLLGVRWQKDGVDVGLRRKANFLDTELTDDATNERVNITPGGGGFDWQESVRVATVAPLAAHVYAGGIYTASANGALTIDGVAMALGNRALIKDEAASDIEHGIVDVIDAGSAGSPWVMQRSILADETGELSSGLTVYVSEGTQAESFWTITTPDPIVLNTTPIAFEQKAGLSAVGAWAGQPLTWDGAAWDAGLYVEIRNSGYAGYLAMPSGTSQSNTGGSIRADDEFSIYIEEFGGAGVDGILLGWDSGETNVGSASYSNITKLNAKSTGSIYFRHGGTVSAELTSALNQFDQPIAIGASGYATSGSLRLVSSGTIKARNAGNTADAQLVYINGSDDAIFGEGSTIRHAYLESGTGDVKVRVGGVQKINVASALSTFSTDIAFGTNPASAGTVRLEAGNDIQIRNAADSGDVYAIGLTGTTLWIGQASADCSTLATNCATSFEVGVGGANMVVVNTSTCTVLPDLVVGNTPAQSGVVRLPNATNITYRNAADSADIQTIRLNGTDDLEIGKNTANLGSIIYEVPTGEYHLLRVNGSAKLTVGGSTVDVLPDLRLGSTPSTTGTMGVPSGFQLHARNAANSANFLAFTITGADDVLVGDNNAVNGNVYLSAPAAKGIVSQVGGAAKLTVAASNVTMTVPPVVPTHTIAGGLPAAAPAAQQIYVSDETGGAVICFSDGTNWRRCTDRAIAS